ncbi:double-strand break repair helicase AddA [Rhizobium halophytocola]|uniref:DNA 3'-5' helicase n=1 Tax=Rhizobium halophytocola TaxID=735519 RepID=A0ABS4E1K3_9HYPH|nr:double-strand break repair helicase AddA [Rhizobium halophytocola]MBP1851828.1 ATP-dependent helicase/nuclease subunit A [Rhizobium halophytocola]
MRDGTILPEGANPLDWTTAQQALASDPLRSAWVSANAGSGKTHVLTQRVIRLLLAGARPSAILCLTYTKAAASEMSNRVFSRLAEWARLDDAELAKRIASIEDKQPDRIKLIEARRLFAKALETPGGLKIQTIHAFCEALLHQFPLEANVAGHFSVLDDAAAATLLAEARRSLLTATALGKDADLAWAFEHALGLADEFGLETLLGEIVANRRAIAAFLAYAGPRGGFEPLLRRRLRLEPGDTPEALASAAFPLAGLSGPRLSLYIDLAEEKGGVTAQAIADSLRRAVAEEDPFARLRHLQDAFFTKSGSPKSLKTLATAKMQQAAPELAESLEEAQTHLVGAIDRLNTLRMFEATVAALTLASRLIEDYENLKKRRSQLDFEDLIARTAQLLLRSDAGPWIHYKLDQGIDHMLVDEAQDTSPVQWDVIRSLREDFFAGQSARPGLRTFFAVGDEKQSIYSFQGARPERFAEEGKVTGREVAHAGLDFSAIRLPLSFRSTNAVLSAVDQVFRFAGNARGLSADPQAIIHMSNRIGHPGRTELWEMIAADIPVKDEDWTAPFDATPESAPPAILARRMADYIERMIGNDTIVDKGVERSVEAGDILVLVRKRDSFVTALTRELKRRSDIPVGGADRLKLTSHIAVQDLLALGRFVLLQADDLSLAALLKSPLFNRTEEELYGLAAYRSAEASLFAALIEQAAREDDTVWRSVSADLQRMIELSRDATAHEFFATALGRFGGRRKFLGRLGTEAADILDEFLSHALTSETTGLPGLQAFISALELEAPVIKREQDQARNEVRIMTVHASKGLEAPVVFLVDGGGKPFNTSHLAKFRFIQTPDGDDSFPIWMPVKALDNDIAAADVERARGLAEEEYRRLLYVGMTRAADRLIVCGYRGRYEVPDIWHMMIDQALRQDEIACRPQTFSGADAEWEGLVWQTADTLERFEKHMPQTRPEENISLPPALLRQLPASKRLPRPLSPSGAGVVIEDRAADLVITSRLFGPKQAGDLALQKGRLTHRMLQVLPAIAPMDRAAAAERYLDRAARFWPVDERRALQERVLAVLAHPGLAGVFDGQGEAEVSVMGTLDLGGEERAVSGRLDRLAVLDDRVVLLDYKTNRRPPEDAADVPFSHLAQMAIYRALLQPLYPGQAIECLLIYTETANVVTLPPERMEAALAELKTL